MQIDHVLHDIPPLVHGFLAEIELQKKYNPKEILSNQMTLVMGGMAKILLGGIQTGTGGLAAPFTGPLLAAVDLGTSAARAGLNADADASGALAESATKSVMITSATRAVGPVLPFAIDSGYAAASSVPVVGGLAAIGLGFMDIRAGLQGLILRPGDIVFIRQSLLEINRMRTLIGAKADEMAAIPELRGMSARWRGCGGALAVVATDLSALLAKHAPVSSSSS